MNDLIVLIFCQVFSAPTSRAQELYYNTAKNAF